MTDKNEDAEVEYSLCKFTYHSPKEVNPRLVSLVGQVEIRADLRQAMATAHFWVYQQGMEKALYFFVTVKPEQGAECWCHEEYQYDPRSAPLLNTAQKAGELFRAFVIERCGIIDFAAEAYNKPLRTSAEIGVPKQAEKA